MPFRTSSLLLILTGTAFSLGVAGAALAAEADKQAILDKAFASTIVSTYPDGRQAELWLFKDGGYNAEGRRHERSSGHWSVKGEKLCMRQIHPFPAPFSYCTVVPATALDTPWRNKAFTGEMVTVTFTPGREGAEKGDGVKKAGGAEGREPAKEHG